MDDRTTAQAVDHAWEMMDRIGACMLVTKRGATLRARPMHALVSREENCVWFLSDRRGHKDEELRHDPQSALVFADKAGSDFLSVAGESEVVEDRGKVAALWNGAAAAYWPTGKDDPNIQVLRFLPESAEYWDGPSSSVLIGLRMTAARLTGETPDLGDNRKVPMD